MYLLEFFKSMLQRVCTVASFLLIMLALFVSMGSNKTSAAENPPNFELMWGSGVNTGVPGAEICSAATIPCFAASLGSGDGEFNRVNGVAVSDTGLVYIAEHFGHRVQVFDLNGNYLFQWPTLSNGEAAGIEIDGDIVYVVEHNRHRILVYSDTGTYLRSFGGFGHGDGQFYYPVDVAIDVNENIYVTDRNNNRIQKFAADGSFLTKWGSFGSGEGQFNSLAGIEVSSASEVYVTEAGNHRVQVFDTSGNFIRKWGSNGSGDGQFNHPGGMAFNDDDDIYVVDHGNDRVQKFDSDGTFITKWGTNGGDANEFIGPNFIDYGPDGELYVTEHFGHRVQKFVPAVIQVNIDIKPGGDTNCLNINEHGVIPVAILGAEDFDVTSVDTASLLFGGLEVAVRGKKRLLCSVKYSNTDAYLDLVCQFEDNVDNWNPGVDEATLTGALFDGTLIEGSDSICKVP